MESKEERLRKYHIQVIDKLQEEIQLLKFDLSKARDEVADMKEKLNYKRRAVSKAREELTNMKRLNDYSKINSVIASLGGNNNEE